MDVILSELSPTMYPTVHSVSLWSEFWENVKDINEKLWDAGIIESPLAKLNLVLRALFFHWCKIRGTFVEISV